MLISMILHKTNQTKIWSDCLCVNLKRKTHTNVVVRPSSQKRL